MSFILQKTLPSLEIVQQKHPLTPKLVHQISQDRQEIRDILAGRDQRKLLIVGPCSAWPSEAVVEYAQHLAPLAKKYASHLKIVMRTYIQKPRTTIGWFGPLIQPDPFEEPNIEKGILSCRAMMIRVLELGLPIADEILFPRKESYFRDLLSWAAVGARSAENQEHRILASMMDIPVGMKNPTSGSIGIGINSLIAAQSQHVIGIMGDQICTSGNPYAHLVLRGGDGGPNYRLSDLQKAVALSQKKHVSHPAILVDASHDNTLDSNGSKDFQRQTEVVFDVLDSCEQDSTIDHVVKGFMMESFLQDGKQSLKNSKDLKYGVSITDGCLGFNATQTLIEQLVERLEVPTIPNFVPVRSDAGHLGLFSTPEQRSESLV